MSIWIPRLEKTITNAAGEKVTVSKSNKYWAGTTGGYVAMPNCTRYVYGRWWEAFGKKTADKIANLGNAEDWWKNVRGKGLKTGPTPAVGAVLCLANGPYSGLGHVAVCEKIENGRCYFSESGWNAWIFNKRSGTKETGYGYGEYDFQGFIYAPDMPVTSFNSVIDPETVLDIKDINPYVAGIDRNTKSVDYKLLQNKDVIAVMIEAGYLFDKSHKKVKSYQNPRLDEQYKQAISAKIPIGLYCYTRAKTVMEAKEELEELKLIVQTYPPSMGLWVRLGLSSSKSINDNIIKTYYEKLVNLGFKDQLGIYASRNELKQITWDDFKDKWYLWLIDHLSTMQDVEQLLTPKFFDL